jgi:DNA gyrase/topoisomerase IV subunit A
VSTGGLLPGEEERRARLRLSVLDAYLLAAERRKDVIDAVAEAGNPEEARRSVARLLSIAEDAASGVLDLRVHRFSRSEVAQHRTEATHLRNLLERGH